MVKIKSLAAKGVHEKVLDLLGYPRNSNKIKVLDAASGQGSLSQKMVNRGFKVYPIDINPSQSKLTGIKCYKVDLNKNLPFKKNFFDYALSVETIEHLENPWNFIRELHRVVKPGGGLIITTPNVINIFSRILFLLKGRFILFSKKDVLDKYHINPIPLWVLEAILEKEGFVIDKVTCSPSFIPFIRLYFKTNNLLLGHCLVILAHKKKK